MKDKPKSDALSITASCWTPGGTWGQGFTSEVSIARAQGTWEAGDPDLSETEEMIDLVIESFKEAKENLRKQKTNQSSQ